MTDDNVWWCVQRHSGRTNGRWRTLICGTEAECRRVYEAERVKLRQGTVTLTDYLGEDVAVTSAPRLRSKW